MVFPGWRAVLRYIHHLPPLDRGLEIAAIGLTVGLAVLCALVYPNLPDQIPVHFNSAGYPDAYDSKATIWWLPGLAVACYATLTLLGRLRTSTFGPPPQRSALQVKLGQRLLRVLKLGLALTFFYLAFFQVRIAMTATESLFGMEFFWILFTGMAASVGYVAYRFVREE